MNSQFVRKIQIRCYCESVWLVSHKGYMIIVSPCLFIVLRHRNISALCYYEKQIFIYTICIGSIHTPILILFDIYIHNHTWDDFIVLPYEYLRYLSSGKGFYVSIKIYHKSNNGVVLCAHHKLLSLQFLYKMHLKLFLMIWL